MVKYKFAVLLSFLCGLGMLVSLEDAFAFRPMRAYKFDVSVSASAGDPTVSANRFGDGYTSIQGWYTNPGVENMYAESMGTISYSGLYSIKMEYKPIRWLSVCGNLSYHSLKADIYKGFDRNPAEVKRGNVLYVMPEARFYYFRTKLSTLSSAISFGLGVYSGFEQSARPEVQVYPLSYTLGDRIYGKAELSFGTIINGINFGIGFRF